MAANVTAVVVAFIGFGGVALGIYFSRKGQRRSEDSDRVGQIFQAQKDLTAGVQAERDHALSELEHERDRHNAAMEAARVAYQSAMAECMANVNNLSAVITELRTLVAGQIAAAAAEVSEEDPHSLEAVQRVRKFVEDMKLFGGGA